VGGDADEGEDPQGEDVDYGEVLIADLTRHLSREHDTHVQEGGHAGGEYAPKGVAVLQEQRYQHQERRVRHQVAYLVLDGQTGAQVQQDADDEHRGALNEDALGLLVPPVQRLVDQVHRDNEEKYHHQVVENRGHVPVPVQHQYAGQEEHRQGDDISGRGEQRRADVVYVPVPAEAQIGHDDVDDQQYQAGHDPAEHGDEDELLHADAVHAQSGGDHLGQEAHEERDHHGEDEGGLHVLPEYASLA